MIRRFSDKATYKGFHWIKENERYAQLRMIDVCRAAADLRFGLLQLILWKRSDMCDLADKRNHHVSPTFILRRLISISISE